MTPAPIARYTVLAELGSGGMAKVYRAYDPRFKREVAVKVLPPEALNDAAFRARFEREAETIAALEHPAIVPVYDFGEEAGQPYLVMRLMPGGSLADRLAHGPLPARECARIVERLADALDRAHARGIIHRDLKPGNILFDGDGLAYLSDFGIAKLTAGTATTLTGAGGLVGTPAYMSPEQARGDKALDGRSDIYALGVIVFEMLCGQRPYEADTPMGLAVKHVTEPVPLIRERRPALPPAADGLILRAMAKQPAQRYPTAAALAADLTALAASLPEAASQRPVSATLVDAPLAGATEAVTPLPTMAEPVVVRTPTPEPPAPPKSAAASATVAEPLPARTPTPKPPTPPPARPPTPAPPAPAERVSSPEAAPARTAGGRRRGMVIGGVVIAVVVLCTAGTLFSIWLLPQLFTFNLTTSTPAVTAAATATSAPSATPAPPTIAATATLDTAATEAANATSTGQARATGTAGVRSTGTAVALATAGARSTELAAIGGGSGQIAYDSNPSGPVGLYLVDADGRSIRSINLGEGAGQAFAPAWSPDGRRLAYVSARETRYQINILDLETGQVRNISDGSADDFSPDWSPDGQRIVFTSASVYTSTATYEIYVINVDGSGRTQLTSNNTYDEQAAWSPDGTRIAFGSERDGNTEIYLMDAEGGDVTRVTSFQAIDAYPEWSPDGTRLVYASNRGEGGNWDIYTMDLAGGSQVRLTDDPAVDSRPAWSPNGEWIAFESDRTGSDDLYRMRTDGTDVTRLTTTGSRDLRAAWRP